MDSPLPLEILLLLIIIFGGSIVLSIFGLLSTELKFNKPDDVKVFNVTALLALVFWFLLLRYLVPLNYVWSPLPLVLSICTGIGAGKLTERYGTKGYIIPRFLLGFIVSQPPFYLLLWMFKWRFVYSVSSIIGLLFASMTFLTSDFIIAFLVLFGYSYLLANTLAVISKLVFGYSYAAFIVPTVIGYVPGIIRLCYYYKVGPQPIIGSNTTVEGESQFINNGGNSSYMAVNTDEEANIG